MGHCISPRLDRTMGYKGQGLSKSYKTENTLGVSLLTMTMPMIMERDDLPRGNDLKAICV